MQVKCIAAHGLNVPGDVVEVPDGSSVDPNHWVAVAPPPKDAPMFPLAPPLVPAGATVLTTPVKEGI